MFVEFELYLFEKPHFQGPEVCTSPPTVVRLFVRRSFPMGKLVIYKAQLRQFTKRIDYLHMDRWGQRLLHPHHLGTNRSAIRLQKVFCHKK